jgi:hypothetical protein
VSLEDINSKLEKMKCEKAVQVPQYDINSGMKKIKILQAENEFSIRVVCCLVFTTLNVYLAVSSTNVKCLLLLSSTLLISS